MSDAASESRPAPRPRADFIRWRNIDTRWMDNDIYGHVNNAVYYSYFDTTVNAYLIEAGLIDPHAEAGPIGLVVETRCRYFAPLAFPQRIDAGLCVGRIGRTSVRYEIGLFAAGAPHSAAHGHFVHVYVDRATRRPADLPPALKTALEGLL